MKKLLIVLAILVVTAIMPGCSNEQAEADAQEVADAQNLVAGLNMMLLMSDQSYYNPSGTKGPPLFWSGPNVYNLPEGDDSLYYEYAIHFPWDSLGVFKDSLRWLIMFSPDIWETAFEDSLALGIDMWFIGMVRDDIYFHTIVNIPDTTHITGTMKWNWTDTWWQYEFDNSTIDEAAELDITSSDNIRISAHFLFDSAGAGELEDNWGKFQDLTFVRFEFFAEPDTGNYDGFYQLLSEDWKVDHYFTLIE